MRKRYVVVDLKTNRFMQSPYGWPRATFGPADDAYDFDWSDPERGFLDLCLLLDEEAPDALEGRMLSVVTVYVKN